MDLWLLSTLAWLLVGAVCAAAVYLDMRKLNRLDPLWVAVVFLLPIIGLVVYFLLVRGKAVPYEYPPKPSYPAPDYKFEKPSAAGQKAATPNDGTRVEQIEGIPRCDKCGAAISAHDEKCPKCGMELRPG